MSVLSTKGTCKITTKDHQKLFVLFRVAQNNSYLYLDCLVRSTDVVPYLSLIFSKISLSFEWGNNKADTVCFTSVS